MRRRIPFLLVMLIAVAGLLLLSTGCTTTPSQEESTPTPIPTPIVPVKPTYEVQRGEVVERLQFSGRISPVVEEELFFRVDGRVRNVYAARGDVVTTGQVLADLEILDNLERRLAADQLTLRRVEVNVAMTELYLQLTQLQGSATDTQIELAQANLDAAQARYDAAINQESVAGNNVTTARIRVDQATRSLADAQEAYDKSYDPGRDWELDAYGDRLENEREAATRNLQFAQENLTIAQANYNLVVGGLSGNGALDAETAVISAEATLANAQIGSQEHEIALAIKEYELELANIALEEALLGMQDLEATITDAQIVAPFDGELVSFTLSDGRILEAYKTVGVVADMNQLEIRADLSTRQLEGVVEGMPVRIELASRPGEEIAGYVRQLPYRLGRSDTKNEDDSTRIVLKNASPADLGLQPGDLMRMTIVLEQRDDVLWLPPQAIRTFEGRTFVVIQVGGAQQRVDVKLGIEGEDRVEIETGLDEGQIVVGP